MSLRHMTSRAHAGNELACGSVLHCGGWTYSRALTAGGFPGVCQAARLADHGTITHTFDSPADQLDDLEVECAGDWDVVVHVFSEVQPTADTRCEVCDSLNGGHTMGCQSRHLDRPKPRQEVLP